MRTKIDRNQSWGGLGGRFSDILAFRDPKLVRGGCLGGSWGTLGGQKGVRPSLIRQQLSEPGPRGGVGEG